MWFDRDFTLAGKVWLVGHAGRKGKEVRIVVRSTDITLARQAEPSSSTRYTLSGTVDGVEMDGGPFAGVSLAIDGEGHLFALATRRAIDELAISAGDRIFALLKTVALDERAVANKESLTET